LNGSLKLRLAVMLILFSLCCIIKILSLTKAMLVMPRV